MTNSFEHLQQTREHILECALQRAPYEGWTNAMLRKAVLDANQAQGAETLYFSLGILDLLDFWSLSCDQTMHAKLEDETNLQYMKIRERISHAVQIRILAMEPHREAAARAYTRLLMPDATAKSMQILWRSCDAIWRSVNDTSTDFNYYTKRATLAAVYSTTLIFWLYDESEHNTHSWEFLNRRIENVMQFETLKKTIKQNSKKLQILPAALNTLASVRYGSTPNRRDYTTKQKYSDQQQ